MNYVEDKFENGKLKYEGQYVFEIYIEAKQKTKTDIEKQPTGPRRKKFFFESGELFQVVANVEFELEFGSPCYPYNESIFDVDTVWLRLPVDCVSSPKTIKIEITDCFTDPGFKRNFISQCFVLDPNEAFVLRDFNNGVDLDLDTYNNIVRKAKKLLLQKELKKGD